MSYSYPMNDVDKIILKNEFAQAVADSDNFKRELARKCVIYTFNEGIDSGENISLHFGNNMNAIAGDVIWGIYNDYDIGYKFFRDRKMKAHFNSSQRPERLSYIQSPNSYKEKGLTTINLDDALLKQINQIALPHPTEAQ